jgi:hypothetical protein
VLVLLFGFMFGILAGLMAQWHAAQQACCGARCSGLGGKKESACNFLDSVAVEISRDEEWSA